jgi:putative Mg2+ transporter-C (MgtC) family protein
VQAAPGHAAEGDAIARGFATSHGWKRGRVTISTVDVLLRVLLAAGLGAVVGAEREWRHHVAGMRTHALVALGAALFTLAGAYGFSELVRSSNTDPMRVAAQVASGIGFVGAGAILRHGTSVRGLTTAATLWASAALGVAAGAGFFPAALAGVGVVLVSLLVLRRVRPLLGEGAWLRRLTGPGVHQCVFLLDYHRGRGTLGFVLDELARRGASTIGVALRDDGDRTGPGRRHAELRIRASRREDVLDTARAALELDEVVSVEVLDPNDDGGLRGQGADGTGRLAGAA